MMNEAELLVKKNKQIAQDKVIKLVQQIVIYVLLAGYIFLLFISRISPPEPNARIQVIDRYNSLCADGEKAQICVPQTIVAGESFEYKGKGKKLVSNSASIQFQVNCKVNGTESILNVGSVPYSNIPKGEFEIKRTFTIPVTTRTLPSDDCLFQSVAVYTFYQTINNSEQPIDIKNIGTSNHFVLQVKKESLPTTSNVNPANSTAFTNSQSQTIASNQAVNTTPPTTINNQTPPVETPQEPEIKPQSSFVTTLLESVTTLTKGIGI